MNKTIIININGTVFHIEEDAYEILKNYMTEVKRYFMNSADSLEITTDIENRIAEMFTEILLSDAKQALTEQDVKTVVSQMGSVEDFATAEDTGANEPSPFAFSKDNASRKLFRDPDDHLLGGVCAGIAKYFDFGVLWVRLAFLVSLIFFGTGIFIYVILWLVVPKAVTRIDRMAMRGEKLDLQGFKRNFEVEMGSVKEGFKGFERESRPFVYKTRDFAGDFFGHLANFIRTAGKLFLKLAGIASVLFCLGLLIFIVVIVVAYLGYDSTAIYNMPPFNIVNHQVNIIFAIFGALLIGIPLLAIILLAISVLFKQTTFTKTTGLTLLAIWGVALCVVIYQTTKAVADFKYSAGFRKTVPLAASSNGTYYLKLNDIKYLSGEDSVRLKVNERFKGMIIIEDDNNNGFENSMNWVNIDIERSDVSTPVLVESFSARGRTYEDALINARGITYQFAQRDSVLEFAPKLERVTNTLWRDQDVHLTLKLPLNAKVVIDNEIASRMSNIDQWNCKDLNKQHDAPSATFIITNDGAQCKVDTLVTAPVIAQKDSASAITDTTKAP